MNELTTQDESMYDTSVPDESLTEIAEHCPELNDQQRRYVYWRVIGMGPTIAFRNAGYTGSNWRTIETRPKIREAIAKMVEVTEPEHRISEKTIINIVMEGVQVAREKGQAHNLIMGAKTLAEITGHIAAQKIEMNQQSKVEVTHTHEMKLLGQLERSQLERLLDIERVLPHPDAIEGEYTVETRQD